MFCVGSLSDLQGSCAATSFINYKLKSKVQQRNH